MEKEKRGGLMNVVMGKAGRVVIPVSVREQLAFSVGTPLEVVVRDSIIELPDRRRKFDSILNAFSERLMGDGGSLVDALIEERRAEAAREAVHDPRIMHCFAGCFGA